MNLAPQQMVSAIQPTIPVSPQQMPIANQQIDWSSNIAEVIREQFGLRPKQQSAMYRTPYPPAYDQLPFPHKYKVPDLLNSRGREIFPQSSMLTGSSCKVEKQRIKML
jgi:hypothetical protein